MISSYDFGLISELLFFLRSPQRVMIGVAGLLFPIDGTHEQQLAGYSSALVLFFLSPRVVIYFSFSVPCLDVNTPFFLLLLTDMSLFLTMLVSCHLFILMLCIHLSIPNRCLLYTNLFHEYWSCPCGKLSVYVYYVLVVV